MTKLTPKLLGALKVWAKKPQPGVEFIKPDSSGNFVFPLDATSLDDACSRIPNTKLYSIEELREMYPDKEPDHWTMPEDPETKAGWGIFNFNFIMKPFKEAVEWHDKVTSKGSTAQKIGIPNWRINLAWRQMLEERAKAVTQAGILRRTAWAAGFLVAKVNRYFYEGPIGKTPEVRGDPYDRDKDIF